jgi:hypothetical protein
MLQGNCCICGEEVKSMYSSIKHLDNGKSRIYNGHKRCLFLLEDKLSKGETIEYKEINTPKFNA